ncbi:hypothetical protein ASPVEDRAFT_85480 [Aspergillus versicolor CBS 583.65]|uniref:Zn(2)-C6 fungal-type domain-containing protein n=1 Tax=Aspergillus versicolor CBS 583.65 TaxID=1036611 RepID=A0A1L9PRA6_ASPVE|nr:uncharacterized protein ASPVEDRAFT_85480 [Aspergillus versicolor CBS 583.65]OJJ04067.1 hypothetical protein ASPVEDRAFT_85480 [Aspergillus versicolor CBS 583.65]
MATLRKACRHCTTSKRKCVVQLPKCTRCAQRGLECLYDLEPLGTSVAQSGKQHNLSWSSSIIDTPAYCLIGRVSELSHIDPAICPIGNPNALKFVHLGYRPVLDLLKSGKPAIFIHPKLRMHRNCNHFDALGDIENGVTRESFRRLIELDINVVPIMETLAALQSLLIHIGTFVSNRHFTGKDFLGLILAWTESLLASAQTRMPPNQSPWQAWIFGESVRRTIIMSYTLVMSISSFEYGYCSHWLFLESLPFDRRAGLWMAGSPQAWIAGAGTRTGQEVGEQLISLHKFGEILDGSDDDFHGDSFLALVALSHNGGEQSISDT